MSKKNYDNMSEEEDHSPIFFIPQKVDAFVTGYEPCQHEEEADDIFTEIRLRQYFEAYPRPTGDPLVDYLEALSRYGFHMRNSILGQPAIFCRYR